MGGETLDTDNSVVQNGACVSSLGKSPGEKAEKRQGCDPEDSRARKEEQREVGMLVLWW